MELPLIYYSKAPLIHHIRRPGAWTSQQPTSKKRLPKDPGWTEQIPASWYQMPHIRAVEYDPIRFMERCSIRAYLERHQNKLCGRVLDFGAGEQPYRDLIQGEYIPLEIGQDWEESGAMIPPEGGRVFGPWTPALDAILCTQVLQYVDYPDELINDGPFWNCLKPGGHLVLTFPTCWDEVPGDCYKSNCDRWRFTEKGMRFLLEGAGFEIVDMTRRAEVRMGSFTFPLGYGCVARKPA